MPLFISFNEHLIHLVFCVKFGCLVIRSITCKLVNKTLVNSELSDFVWTSTPLTRSVLILEKKLQNSRQKQQQQPIFPFVISVENCVVFAYTRKVTKRIYFCNRLPCIFLGIKGKSFFLISNTPPNWPSTQLFLRHFFLTLHRLN